MVTFVTCLSREVNIQEKKKGLEEASLLLMEPLYGKRCLQKTF